MRYNKKSQFIILSGMFLILLLIFIYSQETENYYISNSAKNNILDNMIYETCYIGKYSNGSNLDFRFENYSNSISNYCDSLYQVNCSLLITKQISAPTNLTLLNYSHYDYFINYSNQEFSYTQEFNC